MKRSNIILIWIGLVAFVLIAAVPVLYRVELSKARRSQGDYSRLVFNDAKVVKVQSMQGGTIVPSDSLAIFFKEEDKNNIHIRHAGDTLVLTGTAQIIIFTGKREIVAVESSILVKGDLKWLDAFSLSVNLRDSYIYSMPMSKDSKEAQHLGEFRIAGNGTSIVDLNGRFDIDHLYVSDVKEFNCSSQVGLWATDFSFSKNANVQTMSCRDGMNIVVR
jgi:hypothetical protein